MAITIDGSSGIASVDGSAGSPSLRGSDANSGIFYSTDEIMFSVGGEEIAKISEATNGDSLHLGDNKRFTVGGTADSPDCYFYADSSNTNIQNITGDMFIRSNADGDKAIVVRNGAGTDLYYDNAKKFETTSTGIALHGLSTGTGNSTMHYNHSSGQVTYDTSSRLVKTDIADSPYGIDIVKQLKPRKYKRTDQETTPVEIGFIADEVESLIPEIVPNGPKSIYTKNDSDTELIPINVEYQKLTVVLTTALQEAITKIETLETKVAALEAA